MGILKAAVYGAVAGGFIGIGAGELAAGTYHAASEIRLLAADNNTVNINDFEQASTDTIRIIFEVGSVALGAVLAASTSLSFKYVLGEAKSGSRDYSE